LRTLSTIRHVNEKNDEFHNLNVKTVEEAKQLIAKEFEQVCTYDDI